MPGLLELRPERREQLATGERIFREVGVELGVRTLGLTIDPASVWGIGRPLPAGWYGGRLVR